MPLSGFVITLLLGLVLFACSDAPTFITPPPGTEAGAVIFALEGVPGAPAPIATELESRVELMLADDLPETARLVARVFGRDLEALAIEPGDVPIAGSEGRALLHDAGFTHVLTAAEEASWAPAELAPLLVEAPEAPCPRLELTQQPLDTNGEIGFVLARDGEHVWVGVRDRSLWEATTNSVRRLDDLGPEVPLDVGHRGPLGDWWLGGAGGRIFAARASTSSLSGSLIVDDPSLGLVQWLAGGQLESGGFEVFAESQEGIVFRVRGADERGPVQVDVLHRFDVPRASRGAGIAWLGPGRAVASSEWSGELVFFDGAEVTMMRPPIQENTGITSVAQIPGFGLVVGDSKGSVAHLDGAWRSLGTSGINFLIHVIAPGLDGFFVMGTLGYVSRYDPMNARFCEPEKLGQSTLYSSAVLDTHVVLADTNPSAVRTFVRFVKR